MSSSPGALVTDAAAPVALGDPDLPAVTLRDVFEQHYAELVAVVAATCGDRQTAEDAVQEAFARAAVRWSRVGRLASPAGWVLHVATNWTRSDWRKRRRLAPSSAAGSDVAVSQEPVDVDLRRAVASLPERQRQIVALYYLADLPGAEIATMLRIAPGTVKRQLSDARSRLRATLGGHGGR